MNKRLNCMLALLAGLISGCAGSATNPGDDRGQVAGLSAQRVMLSHGYSLLYQDAGKLDYAHLVLYVKLESQAVDDLVTATSEFGGELKGELKRIAKDYPGVRIDLEPLPEIETRKRRAIAKTRALYFLPVVGRSGREYERTVLIGFSNAFNHERHLCKVMADEEPDAGLKKFLLRTERRYDALYARTMDLLDKEYFSNPKGK